MEKTITIQEVETMSQNDIKSLVSNLWGLLNFYEQSIGVEFGDEESEDFYSLDDVEEFIKSRKWEEWESFITRKENDRYNMIEFYAYNVPLSYSNTLYIKI